MTHYSHDDKEGLKALRKEWEQKICPDTDAELITRFNNLGSNIRKRRFSYGVIMSVYMRVMEEELDKRFDISEIAKFNNGQISTVSYNHQIYLSNRKVFKKNIQDHDFVKKNDEEENNDEGNDDEGNAHYHGLGMFNLG